MLSVQFNSSGENNYVSADKTDGIEPCVCVILVELYLWGHVLEEKKKEHFVMGTLVVVGTFCRCPRVRRYFEVQFSVRIRTAVRLE